MEKIKLFCVSLGCDKNLVDTEKMLGVAGGLGVSFTDDETEADAILINTCCFIGDAKEESVNTILDMARYKEEGKCRALIVAGCLAQRYKQEIIDEIPEVDAILGTTSYEEIGNVLTRLFGENGEEKKAEHISCFHDLKRTADAGRKTCDDHRWTLCFFKDRGRVRQALYLLYHPLFKRALPQCAYGAAVS